jgi:hypothetical protein
MENKKILKLFMELSIFKKTHIILLIWIILLWFFWIFCWWFYSIWWLFNLDNYWLIFLIWGLPSLFIWYWLILILPNILCDKLKIEKTIFMNIIKYFIFITIIIFIFAIIYYFIDKYSW